MSTFGKLRSNSLSTAAFLLTIVVFARLVAPQEGVARSSGPFTKFSGHWRGAGEIVGSDGRRERISCRASYETSEAGMNLTQSLVCASDSYRFDIHSNAVADGENVQGDWQEATRNVSGSLKGSIQNGIFEGSVEGAGFTAQLSLRTNGRKQSVVIVPRGADIQKVDIALTHGG
jgi:hypothetical protein